MNRSSAAPKRKPRKKEGVCIPLDDGWRIESDIHCWMLCRRRGQGDEYRPKFYYPKLRQLLEKYYDVRLRTSEARSLVDLEELARQVIAQMRSRLEPQFEVRCVEQG